MKLSLAASFLDFANMRKVILSPLLKYSFSEWSRLRGQRDQIREIIVKEGVPDIADHVVEVKLIGP